MPTDVCGLRPVSRGRALPPVPSGRPALHRPRPAGPQPGFLAMCLPRVLLMSLEDGSLSLSVIVWMREKVTGKPCTEGRVGPASAFNSEGNGAKLAPSVTG